MMPTATGHWIDAHEVPIYFFFFFFNQVVSTSEAPRGYSHHPHIEKERNNSGKKQKGTEREEKQTE